MTAGIREAPPAAVPVQRARAAPAAPRPSRAGAHGPAAARGRLRALDGLRLLAALMVAAYHYGGRNGDIGRAWGTSPAEQFPTAHALFAYGALGVQVFFVISGFVICMSGWGRPLRSFVASRVSRLYPAYWVAVVLVCAVFALPGVIFDAVSPSDALVNLTMLQQPAGAERVLGVCWTLWVELRFYALFALLVILPGGATRRRVVLFCGGWTLAAVVADAADWAPLELVAMPEHAPFFIGGMGLYLLHRFGNDAAAWAIVAAGWLLGQHSAVESMATGPNPEFAYRPSIGVIAVVTLGFAAVAAVATGRLRWANWRWLTVAGALTYPFYLVHEHLGWVAVHLLHQGLGLPSWQVFFLTLAGMLGLAWALHTWVERPLAPRLKRALDG